MSGLRIEVKQEVGPNSSGTGTLPSPTVAGAGLLSPSGQRSSKSPKELSGLDASSLTKLLQVDQIGPYRLVGKLGKGGAGTVYQGVHTVTGMQVAVKRINLTGLSPTEQQQLENEIKFLEVCKHDNIVKYLDTFKAAASLNIVLEYVDGGTLPELLAELNGEMGMDTTGQLVRLNVPPSSHGASNMNTPRSPRSKLEILDRFRPEEVVASSVQQMLLGLEYLHKNNIVHRDVKGANLLSTREGVIKLTDFGVAKVIEDATKMHSVIGTPYWMAPEVIEMSAPLSTKCDIWSVGCTVLELVTGSPPFGDCNPMSALYKMVRCDPPLPDNISPELRDFLLLTFLRDPVARPTATALLSHPWIRRHHTAGLSLFSQHLPPSSAPSSATTSEAAASKALPRTHSQGGGKADTKHGTLNNKRGADCPSEEAAAVSAAAESVSVVVMVEGVVDGVVIDPDPRASSPNDHSPHPSDLPTTLRDKARRLSLTLPFSKHAVCARCKGVIKGSGYYVLGLDYHVEHLHCASCKKPLTQHYFPSPSRSPQVPFCDSCFARDMNNEGVEGSPSKDGEGSVRAGRDLSRMHTEMEHSEQRSQLQLRSESVEMHTVSRNPKSAAGESRKTLRDQAILDEEESELPWCRQRCCQCCRFSRCCSLGSAVVIILILLIAVFLIDQLVHNFLPFIPPKLL